MAQMTGQRHCLNDMPAGTANSGVFRGDDTVAFTGFFLEYGAISNLDCASRFDHGTRLLEIRELAVTLARRTPKLIDS